MLYKKLLITIEQRKGLEKEINSEKEKFENSIAPEKALLEDLLNTEAQQRKELLVFMQENNVDNKKIDNHLIARNVRITNQIKNAELLATAVAKNKEKILALGIAKEQIDNLFKNEIVITDKKLAVDIVNNFEKVEDELLAGCEKKFTEFLTVA